MADIEDFALGSDGKWYSPNAPRPPGVTLTSMPESSFATPHGGQVATRPINTPNSSSGEPIFKDPSATGWSTEFSQPKGGQLTTTPNSRTGAPAPRIVPRLNPATMPGWASVLGRGGLWGLGAELMGKTIEPQPTNAGEDEVLKRFIPAPNSTIGTQTGDTPIAQPYPQSEIPTPPGSPPLPPVRPQMGPPVPPGGLPPLVQAPIPVGQPVLHGRTPSAQRQQGAPNLGYGIPQQAAPQAPSSMFTTIDRPNADISGGPSVGGQLAPQYFNRAREPGGPAQMGALDLSGLFNHPAVAQAAAAHPAVQGALAAQQGGGWQGAVGAPNMNDAALGQQIIGNGWSGGARGQNQQQQARPTPGGFGFDPRTQSPFGYGP